MRLAAVVFVTALLLATPASATFMDMVDGARMGDLDLVRRNLDAGIAPNGAAYGFSDSYSPLMWAAGNGDVAMTALLLQHGAETEHRDFNGDRALLWAAEHGHAKTVQLLLDAGSPPDADADPYGQTPLMAAAYANHHDAALALLAGGADPRRQEQSGYSALHFAARSGDAALGAALIAAGADPSLNDEAFGDTPLHEAAVGDRLPMLEMLVAAGADLEARNDRGETPLFAAAARGRAVTVAALLAAGADPDARSAHDLTPIIAALEHLVMSLDGYEETAALLVPVTADIDRAFAAALWGGHPDIAMALLERGADVNAVDPGARPALAGTTQVPGLKLFEMMVARGADLSLQGHAALISAADAGREDIALRLLALGVPIDGRDAAGATALMHAVVNGHVACARVLLDHGADPDPSDALGRGLDDYMAIMPLFYGAMIADYEASRAYKPTDALEAQLAAVTAAHAAIRLLLAAAQ